MRTTLPSPPAAQPAGEVEASRIELLLGARAGEEVSVVVDLIVTDDWTTPALLPVLAALGTKRAAVPVVLVRDHTREADHYRGADYTKVLALRGAEDEFVKLVGARQVSGQGIQHHALPDLGLLRPGMVVLGNDSHTPTLGAFGVAAFAGQPTTIAAAIHSGVITLRVPDTLRVVVRGKLRPGVTIRDAAFTLLAELRAGSPDPRLATGKALEFRGPGLKSLTAGERALLANIAPEAVAVTSTFADDDFQGQRESEVAGAGRRFRNGVAEPIDDYRHDANGSRQMTANSLCNEPSAVCLDLDKVEPVVARSGNASDVVPLELLEPLRVDRVFVGTCAGGTYEEIGAFATALDGPVVVPTVVTPASRAVRERLEAEGIWAQLEAAGVDLWEPGCGACFGFGWRLADGEVAVTTGNRNGVGRMGASTSSIFLASGATAARAASSGRLAAVVGRAAGGSGEGSRGARPAAGPRKPEIVWPTSGNVLRVHGLVTTDDLTPSNVPGIGTSSDPDPAVGRRLLFHHLDTSAATRDLRGFVVVADENFGSGSNRASAVRALKAAGIKAIVARSVAPLYAMGARDEGLPVYTLSDQSFFELATSQAVIVLDSEVGSIAVAGSVFNVEAETPFERDVRLAGGLVELMRERTSQGPEL